MTRLAQHKPMRLKNTTDRRRSASDIEINYDKHGNEKTVLLPYAVYRELIDAIEIHEPKSESPDIRSYQGAKGYYVDSVRFCVLAGSIARGRVTSGFRSKRSVARLRDYLIGIGILQE